MSLTESVFLASLWFLAAGVLCLCAFVAYVWKRTNIPRDEWDSDYPGAESMADAVDNTRAN